MCVCFWRCRGWCHSAPWQPRRQSQRGIGHARTPVQTPHRYGSVGAPLSKTICPQVCFGTDILCPRSKPQARDAFTTNRRSPRFHESSQMDLHDLQPCDETKMTRKRCRNGTCSNLTNLSVTVSTRTLEVSICAHPFFRCSCSCFHQNRAWLHTEACQSIREIGIT